MSEGRQQHIRESACANCGLPYARDYAPDERYHRRVHDSAVGGHRTMAWMNVRGDSKSLDELAAA
jgi:hypothetical protein